VIEEVNHIHADIDESTRTEVTVAERVRGLVDQASEDVGAVRTSKPVLFFDTCRGAAYNPTAIVGTLCAQGGRP
jgi:hypothetical protein